MDDMVLLAAILVVGPFIFFVVMVCILKIIAYLNIDVLKTDTTPATAVNIDIPQPSNVHRYVFDNCIDAADLNESYLYGDRWMTGLSIAAHLPIQIALSDITLQMPSCNTVSQIPAQTPVRSPDISNSRQPTANTAVTGDEETRSIFSEAPPDYNLARQLLDFQNRYQPTPPPSYSECVYTD